MYFMVLLNLRADGFNVFMVLVSMYFMVLQILRTDGFNVFENSANTLSR